MSMPEDLWTYRARHAKVVDGDTVQKHAGNEKKSVENNAEFF